jgi:hypothetical protein
MAKLQKERTSAKKGKPSTKGALAEKTEKEAAPLEPLSPLFVLLCYIGAVAASLASIIGVCGIAVLLGEPGLRVGVGVPGLGLSAWHLVRKVANHAGPPCPTSQMSETRITGTPTQNSRNSGWT